MIGYPLDSRVVFNNGVPEYDRAISSAPLRELFRRLFSDGVLPDAASNLQVQYVGSTRVSGTVNGDANTYNVVVNPGFGICAGCLKLQENYYGLTMDISETSSPRIDTVVLRLDNNDSERSCDFHIVQGVPSQSPVAPALTRNSSVWEIGLANLHKPPIVSSANPITVTDTRLDTNRCGVISSISEFDTSALYTQIQDALHHYETTTEEEFNTWFESMKDQLSGDVAGNLQTQIGVLASLTTTNKSDLVSAVNEVVTGAMGIGADNGAVGAKYTTIIEPDTADKKTSSIKIIDNTSGKVRAAIAVNEDPNNAENETSQLVLRNSSVNGRISIQSNDIGKKGLRIIDENGVTRVDISHNTNGDTCEFHINDASGDDITLYTIGAQERFLCGRNKTIATSAWASDTTYTEYPYRASVALPPITAVSFVEIVFSPTDATSGNFAPVCDTYAGGVYIYAKAVPDAAITIPTIIIWR